MTEACLCMAMSGCLHHTGFAHAGISLVGELAQDIASYCNGIAEQLRPFLEWRHQFAHPKPDRHLLVVGKDSIETNQCNLTTMDGANSWDPDLMTPFYTHYDFRSRCTGMGALLPSRIFVYHM